MNHRVPSSCLSAGGAHSERWAALKGDAFKAIMQVLRPSPSRLALYPGGAILAHATALIAYRVHWGYGAPWDGPSYVLALATLVFTLLGIILATARIDGEGVSQFNGYRPIHMKWVDVVAVALSPNGRYLRMADERSIVSLHLWAYSDKEALLRRVRQEIEHAGHDLSEIFPEG